MLFIMIGVISKLSQRLAIEEFFQLFKTPWEYYNSKEQYDVIIMTEECFPHPKTKLLILFSVEPTNFDKNYHIQLILNSGQSLIKLENNDFPVFKTTTFLDSSHHPIIKSAEHKTVGLKIKNSEMQMLRIGYDLFDEIEYLITQGQDAEYAHCPTLDIHIELLKRWILDSGIQIIEIPPVPEPYNFTVCLTHDVDFINITDHRFDSSVLGYILRSIFPTSLTNWRSKIVWYRIVRNWKALVSLPFVYLGMAKDIWFDIDRYCEIEKDIPSTYFFLPFKGKPGKANGKIQSNSRGMKYDINDYKSLIDSLLNQGHEVGLHGIDAWDDDGKGRQEREVLGNLTGQNEVGIRIHWLYFKRKSPSLLEGAGFRYDSTLGYNDAIGYKAGTSQIFKLPDTKKLLELPLTIMDTTLFYKKRMGVTESKAYKMIKKLINQSKKFGGVLTINWHTRSLNPERNWDDFYLALLDLLKSENVWFASAGQAVRWFELRRKIEFKKVSFQDDMVNIQFQNENYDNTPAFQVRIHTPQSMQPLIGKTMGDDHPCFQVPLEKGPEMQIPLSG
jgi:peptidoglycan/xylan/chitin deacetylase (PgdA/CDA1 family)